MKRRNLCRTRKLLAVIIAASMSMNSGMVAMADQLLGTVESGVGNNNENNNVDNTVNVTAPEKENDQSKDATGKVAKNATSSSDKPAVNVSSYDGYIAEVTVTGNVEATNTSGIATGVKAKSYGNTESSSSDKNSSTSVTVEGEVSASAEKGYATGISADSRSGGSTAVSVGDEVSASAKDGSATGINADSHSGGSTDVTAEKSVSATVTKGDSSATGLYVSANGTGSTTNVTVGDDVSATTSGYRATGVSATANTGATVNVKIGDDLTVSSSNGYSGISANAFGEKSSVNVTVDGDVSATKTSDNSGSDDSSAISTSTYTASSSVNVNVGGNVTGNGGIYASGSGQTNITVGGSVVQESQKSETQLTASESSSGGIAITLSDGEYDGSETADVTVKVAKNVTADTTAVKITKNTEKSDIHLEVDGTISGGEHNIVLSEKSSLDNLDITVWRVDTSDEKNVVETLTSPTSEDIYKYEKALFEWQSSGNQSTSAPEKPQSKYTANLDAEKMINYIIKVDDVQTPGGNLGIAGASAGGVYTAHQNDTVYLEVTIPDGYTIDGFYNVDGAADVTVISGDGKYYLNVPRGGGVYVGVKMKKIESTATLDPTPSSSASTSTSYSTYGSGDHRKSESNDQNWTVGNNPNDNSGNRTTLPPEFTGLQIHAMTMGGDAVQNLSDVLTFIDPLAALNNFMDKGIPTQGTQNVIGAGIVNFNNLFMASLTDTVDVPVSASVKANQSYTVLFSDGTSIVVPCIMDGLLTIPFNKNTAGLTYMIYGTDMNPGAFVGLTTSD